MGYLHQNISDLVDQTCETLSDGLSPVTRAVAKVDAMDSRFDLIFKHSQESRWQIYYLVLNC